MLTLQRQSDWLTMSHSVWMPALSPAPPCGAGSALPSTQHLVKQIKYEEVLAGGSLTHQQSMTCQVERVC